MYCHDNRINKPNCLFGCTRKVCQASLNLINDDQGSDLLLLSLFLAGTLERCEGKGGQMFVKGHF